MIKRIVSQKPISQVSLSYNSNDQKSFVKEFFQKIFKFVGIKFIFTLLIIFVFVYLIVFLFKKTLFTPQYIVNNIQYDSGSLLKYDDPQLYRAVSSNLKNINFYIIKWNHKSIIEKLRLKYPIIEDVLIEYIGPNTIFVKILFYEPDLLVKNFMYTFGVYDDYIFTIYSGNNIWKHATILNLPSYVSGLNNIEWLFWKQSAKELKHQMEIISGAFASWEIKHMAYLPWWQKTVVFLKTKTIYINNMVDINQQIKNREMLKKYYPDYEKLRDIDLWSLEKDRVIVKR